MIRNLVALTAFCAVIASGGAAGRAAEPEIPPGSPTGIGAVRVLDLETAGKMALAGNPSLEAARERVRQAAERVRQAKSAYWPRIDFTLGASRVWLSDSAGESSLATARHFNPDASISDPEDYYRSRISAAWVLFDGFERRNLTAATRYGETRSRFAERDARRLLLSAVASSFYSAQLAHENITIANADEDFNRRQLKEARARRRVGTGSLSDELNFEVRLNAATAERIRAEQAAASARSLLASLMDLPEAVLPTNLELAELARESEEELVTPDPSSLLDSALDHRPDIRGLELAVRQAEALRKSAKASFYPVLSASAGVTGERAGSWAVDDEDFGYQAGLELRFNIFSGGQRRARVREAAARKTETEKNLESARLRLSAEVQEAAARLASVQRQQVLQRSNAELVRRNRDLAEKEYAAGQGSLVRLNEAQRDLTAARGRLALALVSLRQAWFDVDTVTGRRPVVPGNDGTEEKL